MHADRYGDGSPSLSYLSQRDRPHNARLTMVSPLPDATEIATRRQALNRFSCLRVAPALSIAEQTEIRDTSAALSISYRSIKPLGFALMI
jgi:hypothetical protein